MFVKFHKNRLISDGEISNKHVLLAGSGTPGYSGGLITKCMSILWVYILVCPSLSE